MKIIQTQNNELINFNNCIEISIATGETIDTDSKNMTVFAIYATDIRGSEHELGLYATEIRAENVLELLTDFLSLSNLTLFEMPNESEE
jgi:hypothetical protein